MRDLYSERRSDVAEVCQHILDGKDFEHIPEHRYVHWNYGGKQFMYDTLTTHVEVCENREWRILDTEYSGDDEKVPKVGRTQAKNEGDIICRSNG